MSNNNNLSPDFTSLQPPNIYNYVHQDVKLYNEVGINIRGPFSGTITLNWHSKPDSIIDLSSSDNFSAILLEGAESIIKYFPVRAQWFGLSINVTAATENTLITHIFRKTSSSVQVSNKDNQRLAINLGVGNSMHSAIYDNSGIVVSDVCNNALFVNPSNLIDDNNCLSVGLFTDTNNKINSTVENNSLLTSFSNSKGEKQASTSSNALFYNLTDTAGSHISSIKHSTTINTNALHMTLDSSVATPLYVNYINKSSNNNTEYLFSALVDNSLKQINLPDNSGPNGFALREIGIANETDQTVWLKIYDVSSIPSATINNIKFNIPVPPLETREINMGLGVYFARGVSLKLSNNYDYNDEGSAQDTVYITGSCIVLK